jgi:small-conductance mechanosensitive channel
VDIAIVLGAFAALALSWGAGLEDLRIVATRAIEGITIGPVTLSIPDLLIAIVVFVLALAGTRYIQRLLDSRIFPGTQLDPGVRHSLRTSVGYAGLILAGGFAVSALGINLSNLAIVAGALSVGIGFGLQNIVNNFVSGLILLIERPIKTGDWIVVGANAGIVKRINVRSTEIETFRKSTVLIPNSDFLSQAVCNWTLRDKEGRVDIEVSLPGLPDAEATRRALLERARAHPRVLATPEPAVLLKDFAADSYRFELRAYVGDAALMDEVASDLRFEALRLMDRVRAAA